MSENLDSDHEHTDTRFEERGNLPRLPQSHYQGLAHVHWIFTIQNRKVGYLNEHFFLYFQLIATHAFQRYHIAAPCLCLMPDHIHLLLVGTHQESSEQRLAIHFIRKHLKKNLHPYEFQPQAYDHVLRANERKRDAFQDTAHYIRENPIRAGLSKTAQEWPYQAALIPGYPDLDPFAPDYWERFWKIYHRILDAS